VITHWLYVVPPGRCFSMVGNFRIWYVVTRPIVRHCLKVSLSPEEKRVTYVIRLEDIHYHKS
jgi:hypothetical protein